ncbi:hypothetical protein OE88DRAFT_447104 [Heliocybe sulcata]|uniref:Uncharacterized protein n=1 Tax=Heliocybe sulcata TaxID=5364 RepID=A0A5C3N5B7_9AGAM|nr:hypothetical protein OE88DRAFT_447104 [Heliocybe sulcata]
MARPQASGISPIPSRQTYGARSLSIVTQALHAGQTTLTVDYPDSPDTDLLLPGRGERLVSGTGISLAPIRRPVIDSSGSWKPKPK